MFRNRWLMAIVVVAIALMQSASPASAAGEQASVGKPVQTLLLGSGSASGGLERVRDLQRQLRSMGYAPGPVDGIFGPRTRRAVAAFQRAAGIAVDGMVGPHTREWLRRSAGRANWSAGAVALGTGYRQRHGSDRVREVQRRLRAAGLDPGPLDGRFGPLTESAVRRFQRGARQAVDGEVGRDALRELRSLTADKHNRTRREIPQTRAPKAQEPQPQAPTRADPDVPGAPEQRHDADPWTALGLLTAIVLLIAAGGRRRQETTRVLPRPVPLLPSSGETPPRFHRTTEADWLVLPSDRTNGTSEPSHEAGPLQQRAATATATRDYSGAIPKGPVRMDRAPYADGVGELMELRRKVFRAEVVDRTRAIAPEPRRDITIAGVITGHRIRVVLCLVLVALLLYEMQELLWPTGKQPGTLLEHAWSWGSLLWLGAVIPGTLGFMGMIAYQHSRRLDDAVPLDTLVSFRIVSRGTNREALLSTVRRCQREMAKTPLFPYVIEVVTDTDMVGILPPNDDVVAMVVPNSYRTPNGSLFKARALQYALEMSPIPDDAWIVHLDEETQPTSSGIKGICQMIREEEESGRLRVGQGGILYHRDWRRHPFLTLADNVRTGDDFARFHFQHKLGVTVFGLHGSYIVVRNDLEKSIGFDFGPVGSITEDAFWALVAMEAGERCRWVDGYLEEQSTQSVGDFVRQRRRWFQGLAKVSLHAPVKLRWRICIGTNTFLWALAPFAALYTIGHLFFGFEVRPEIRLLANLSFASFATLYLIGLTANLDEYGICNPIKRVGWTLAQIALLPAFTLMEGLGVLSAIFKPAAGFHVVQK